MNKTILIVDDEPSIRLLMKRILRPLINLGAKVLVAEDGHEGLEMARATKPDLMFLDVMLPVIGGFAVCEKIKSCEHLKNAKVILVTALGQAFDMQMGKQVKSDGYIIKPFKPEDIIRKAENVLGVKV